MSKKHWFHGKASNAKKSYIKKHPQSIYAGARTQSAHDMGNGATAYRNHLSALRAEIDHLKKMHAQNPDDAAIMRSLLLAQRKLATFKRAAMATARNRK